MIERNEIKKNSFESKLYEVIDRLKQESSDDELIFTNPELLDKTIEIMDCKETDKPNVYWSSEAACNVSQTKITSVAKSKFKAESFSKKIDGKTIRCLKFNEKYLNRIKSTYEMPDKIEIITETETEEVTLVTPVTLSRGILPFYPDIMSAKVTAISQNLFDNSTKNKQNYTNQVANSTQKEAQAVPQSVTSVTTVTHLANADNSANKDEEK